MNEPTKIVFNVNQYGEGEFSVPSEDVGASVWGHIKSLILSRGFDHKSTANTIRLTWQDTLTVVREFGTRTAQANYEFRFSPTEIAKTKLSDFAKQVRLVRELRGEKPKEALSQQEIVEKLVEAGFTKRMLKPFQLRDLSHLLSLSKGANFSVPGAGKTTVTFALHILIRVPGQHLIVVSPKAAFQVWKDIVGECIATDATQDAFRRIHCFRQKRRSDCRGVGVWSY